MLQVRAIKRRYVAGILCAALLLGVFFGLRKPAAVPTFASSRSADTIFVIDAGHGGEDGGAISISGKVESEINLAIALKLDALMHFYGLNTEMTRREDISLHSSSATTLREMKNSDFHNRVVMVNAIENATLISIHQNSYPEQKYRGMQVFYASGEDSMALAKQIQETVTLLLDPDNTRQAMKISNSVYLMNNVTCRAVLVECGFLSNPEEDQLLQEGDYQTKVAITIAAACLSELFT